MCVCVSVSVCVCVCVCMCECVCVCVCVVYNSELGDRRFILSSSQTENKLDMDDKTDRLTPYGRKLTKNSRSCTKK